MLEVKSKANELDVVELLEDLPAYDLQKGQRGTVVEVFDNPEESYMVEFIDESGTESKIADWVLPHQISNIDLQAKKIFEQGVALSQQGKLSEASRLFRGAIKLKPSLIGTLHQIVSKEVDDDKDWEKWIIVMDFLFTIDPTYKTARRNLAIASINYGVVKANEKDFTTAISLFLGALRVGDTPDITNLARENLSAAYISLGIQAFQQGDNEAGFRQMERAFLLDPSSIPRKNLGVAYLIMADNFVEIGKFRDAVLYYEHAEEMGQITPEGLNNRAVAHIYLKEVDKAIFALEMASELAQDNSIIQKNISILKSKTQLDSNANFADLRIEFADLRIEKVKENFIPASIVPTNSFTAIAA